MRTHKRKIGQKTFKPVLAERDYKAVTADYAAPGDRLGELRKAYGVKKDDRA